MDYGIELERAGTVDVGDVTGVEDDLVRESSGLPFDKAMTERTDVSALTHEGNRHRL